jgi:hypothetical protein
MKEIEKVYEFLYNSSCCESAISTISIHKTRKGAEIAMMFHKNEVKQKWINSQKEYIDKYPFDFDQDWDIRETKLQE